MIVAEKIEQFLRVSLKYFGKEISLPSNQYFRIDQIIDEEKKQESVYNYMIQYGFQKSGCVSMVFSYSNYESKFFIDEVCVYTQPAEENITIANFSPHDEKQEIGISVNFGLETRTQKYSKLSEIESNSNALKLLDIAISDLESAQILGTLSQTVPLGSNLIPCCNSTTFTNKKIK